MSNIKAPSISAPANISVFFVQNSIFALDTVPNGSSYCKMFHLSSKYTDKCKKYSPHFENLIFFISPTIYYFLSLFRPYLEQK